ncbi:hypothetical protein RhiJN_11098 [Ceratobasidium sp. AG-Ba]|nr:hypothetical protein RhiJN_11098 [Ceratobasidium sp. AG-Ba]
MYPRDNCNLVINAFGTKLSFYDLFKSFRPTVWRLRDSWRNTRPPNCPSGIKNGSKKPTKGSKKDKGRADNQDSDTEDESNEVDEMNPGGKRKKAADEPPKKNNDNTSCVECRRMSQNVTERARKMSQEIIESSICAVHAQHSPEALRAALWFLNKNEILKPNDKRLGGNPAEVRFNQKYEVDWSFRRQIKAPSDVFEYGSICGLGIREKPPPASESADKTPIASLGTETTERKLSIEFLRLDWDKEGPHFNAIYLGSKATLYDREGNTGHFYISQLDDECRKAGWEPDTEKQNAAKKKWKAIKNKWRADKET